MKRDNPCDISDLTTREVNEIIFEGAEVNEPRDMPMWMAEQVICMPHVDQKLVDWANLTIAMALDLDELLEEMP